MKKPKSILMWEKMEKEWLKPPKISVLPQGLHPTKEEKQKAKLMQRLINYQFKNDKYLSIKFWDALRREAKKFVEKEVRDTTENFESLDKVAKAIRLNRSKKKP